MLKRANPSAKIVKQMTSEIGKKPSKPNMQQGTSSKGPRFGRILPSK